MPAWTAGIQVRRDASGDIHVNLGSGTPCRNDDIEEYSLKLTKLSVANSRTPKNPRVTLHAVTNMLVLDSIMRFLRQKYFKIYSTHVKRL